MATLLLRRSPSLKGMRDQFLVHCISAMLESKRRCEKSMAVRFQDDFASTCLHFIEVLRVRRCRLGIDPGAVYYLRSSNDTVVRVGASTSRSTHNLQYTADVPFIKKYSVLYELGEQFKWEKAGDFENWLGSIVNARPKFIQPFYRSANALLVLPTSPHDHHCCWFVDVVQIRENMTVAIPEEFVPYIFAPPDAVVIIHSSRLQRNACIEALKLLGGQAVKAAAVGRHTKY